MVSLEQVNNLYLLLTSVLVGKVPGAVVELGCHTGSTTTVLGQLLQNHDTKRRPCMYTTCSTSSLVQPSVLDRFQANHAAIGLKRQGAPHIHEGDVFETVPA